MYAPISFLCLVRSYRIIGSHHISSFLSSLIVSRVSPSSRLSLMSLSLSLSLVRSLSLSFSLPPPRSLSLSSFEASLSLCFSALPSKRCPCVASRFHALHPWVATGRYWGVLGRRLGKRSCARVRQRGKLCSRDTAPKQALFANCAHSMYISSGVGAVKSPHGATVRPSAFEFQWLRLMFA